MSSTLAPPAVVHCGQPAEPVDVGGTSVEALYGVSVVWVCGTCRAAFAPGARRGDALRRRAAELTARAGQAQPDPPPNW